MTIHLTQGSMSCQITPERGGLVHSLKLGEQEILWMPDDFSASDSSWPGGGIPLCFPFAGRVWHNGTLYKYGLDQAVYPMPLHGFSYASKWSVLHQGTDKAILLLADNDATRTLYPFSFELQLEISLMSSGLELAVTVTHKSPLATHPKMPVALGWHPYFKVAGATNTTLSHNATKYYPVTPSGAAGKISDVTDVGAKPWRIDQPLLNSLIFSSLKSSEAELESKDLPKIQISYGPEGLHQHLVVWSNQPNSFYCVEPWMSLPDAVAVPSGCVWLGAGENLRARMSIHVSDESL